MTPEEVRGDAARTSGPTRSWRRHNRCRGLLATVLATAVVLGGVLVPTLGQSQAGASSIAGLRARAVVVSGELTAEYTRLDVLDEEYDNARIKVADLDRRVADLERAIAGAKRALLADEAHLRSDAIEAYVTDGTSGGLALLENGSTSQVPEQQTYLQAASGNISDAAAAVQWTGHLLKVRQGRLQEAELSARAAVRLIGQDRRAASATATSLQATLASVKGQLAEAVASLQRRQAAARAAAAAA
ncbi:MAG: hypothetical protein ACRD0Z_11680, partial [Acidimicrobiales bacterium]